MANCLGLDIFQETMSERILFLKNGHALFRCVNTVWRKKRGIFRVWREFCVPYLPSVAITYIFLLFYTKINMIKIICFQNLNRIYFSLQQIAGFVLIGMQIFFSGGFFSGHHFLLQNCTGRYCALQRNRKTIWVA